MIALGSFMGAMLGTFAYTGGRFSGWGNDEESQEANRRMRETPRWPVGETVAILGEGRGLSSLGIGLRILIRPG